MAGSDQDVGPADDEPGPHGARPAAADAARPDAMPWPTEDDGIVIGDDAPFPGILTWG